MEHHLSDQELLEELKVRFESRLEAIHNQQILLKELGALNKKLLASEQLKSNFLSNIRNEINNPITSILELAKTIEKNPLDTTTIQKYASLIYSEAFNLDFQLRNIFLSAEFEAGETALSGSMVDLTSLITNACQEFLYQGKKKNVEIKLHSFLREGNTFFTDGIKLYAILCNLLSNALKFSKPNSEVNLYGKVKKNRELLLLVKDEGIGIAKENQHRVFDRFQQLDQGTIKAFQGQGLGLSVVKYLAEILGGTIQVRSMPNKGSLFLLKIKELEISSMQEQTFSELGNDFFFEGSNDLIF